MTLRNLLLLRNTDDFPKKRREIATRWAENHRCHPKYEFSDALALVVDMAPELLLHRRPWLGVSTQATMENPS
ncbi:MAG: hypothetical protein JW888_01545 [Pirellulales bacterium]|nr:hypothetical protein [Pirellulales bacterium]